MKGERKRHGEKMRNDGEKNANKERRMRENSLSLILP